LVQAFTGNNWLATSLEVMNRRYPTAKCLFEEYQNDVGNYVDTGSFDALAQSFMTMEHEETHGWDYEHANGNSQFSFYVTCMNNPVLPWIEGFARSEIAPLVQGSATSLYDGTYLTGTQGTYAWTELLDEWNAYVNGMAAITMAADQVQSGISGTDGAVAFAYYVELYLKRARTQHPTVYAQIKNDAATVAFLKQEWNRMHFFLAFAAQYPVISIEAANIEKNLYDPANQSELEQVVGPLSASNCN
jgi:hypothetical protein